MDNIEHNATTSDLSGEDRKSGESAYPTKRRLEIPFAKDEYGEDIVLSFHAMQREHCYISGMPGSGKTNLIRTLLGRLSAWDETTSEIWFATERKEPRDDINEYKVFKLYTSDTAFEDPLYSIICDLYSESLRRIDSQFHTPESGSACNNFLFAFVCGTSFLATYSERNNEIRWKLEEMLRMSHLTNIKMIFESSRPVSHFFRNNYVIYDLLNVRIVLRSTGKDIYDALNLCQGSATPEEKRQICKLQIGKTGDMLLKVPYTIKRPLLFGHIPIAGE